MARAGKLIKTFRVDPYGNGEGRLELYDLQRDPMEKVNVVKSEKSIAENPEKLLEDWKDRQLRGKPNPLIEQKISMPLLLRFFFSIRMPKTFILFKKPERITH